MNPSFLSGTLASCEWKLSLLCGAGIIAMNLLNKLVTRLVPVMRDAAKLNADTFAAKMAKSNYAANQMWNRKWSLVFIVVIFGAILPFCLTLAPQPWWQMVLDMVVILMVYDFFYYLMHRFTFHDSAFLGGPLKWMHAVHHRQHNPCRWDSSYIHPLEIALGLGLYVATIALLSSIMGRFHVAAIVITWFAFSEINLHNHNLWAVDRFPFRYMSYVSKMHHNHHAKFTGGNFATITLLFDWMFGTLDHGEGGKTPVRANSSPE
jgi:sterol desaturase/sphingolipid hydroxylase (fatty acid hydroxylase superfamily)